MTAAEDLSRPVPGEDPGTGGQALFRRAEETVARSRVLVKEARRISRELDRASAPISRERLLERSAYARLLARLETLPVIEQAKGIIMAQSRSGAAEAFEILRRVSQRSNVPVRDLAARIVASNAGPPAPKPSRSNSTTMPRPLPGNLPRAS